MQWRALFTFKITCYMIKRTVQYLRNAIMGEYTRRACVCHAFAGKSWDTSNMGTFSSRHCSQTGLRSSSVETEMCVSKINSDTADVVYASITLQCFLLAWMLQSSSVQVHPPCWAPLKLWLAFDTFAVLPIPILTTKRRYYMSNWRIGALCGYVRLCVRSSARQDHAGVILLGCQIH